MRDLLLKQLWRPPLKLSGDFVLVRFLFVCQLSEGNWIGEVHGLSRVLILGLIGERTPAS